MSFLSKEDELIDFIKHKKIKKKDINIKKIIIFFSKIIRESIVRPYLRLNDIIWAQECSSIVFNIFWILFSYTNNIKLSMFMCERAILLFNEYIDLAKNTFAEKNNFKINSTDVKLFIYKRTIGPVKIIKNNNKKYILEINKIKECSIYIKHIYNKLSIRIINIYNKNNNNLINLNEEINKYLEYTGSLVPPILQKLCIRALGITCSPFPVFVE